FSRRTHLRRNAVQVGVRWVQVSSAFPCKFIFRRCRRRLEEPKVDGGWSREDGQVAMILRCAQEATDAGG
ncbi:MAG TPA: hypothetical protein VK249_11645, partial [Anaerolineales bacterium]|nr:hypothetical protein [Anaerolineales bacterium]